MNIILSDPLENLGRAEVLIAEAAKRGSSIVLLPELWSTGYDLENAAKQSQNIGTGIFSATSMLARKYRIILGGSMLEHEDSKIYNTFALYGSDGNLLNSYRKIHLFRMMEEDTWLCPGDDLCTCATEFGKIGLSICYDLRFPELYRRYALDEVSLILIPAEWPLPRIEHWRILLRARAIENQVFVAGVNRVGDDHGNVFGGYSAIVNPWGEALAEGNMEECLVTAEIDLDDIARSREKINILADRRPDIYR